MKVIMSKTIKGKGFSFIRGREYRALDGYDLEVEELAGKILVKHPDSPNGKDWWCAFDKSCLGNEITPVY